MLLQVLYVLAVVILIMAKKKVKGRFVRTVRVDAPTLTSIQKLIQLIIISLRNNDYSREEMARGLELFQAEIEQGSIKLN